MAHQLEKNYSSFAGLDTRSNRLLQNPKAFRRGSKNFRYNFQDEIQNANGFQHKDSGAPSFVDIFEYKYRDVNTGKAETQLLGVATDGKLWRKLEATLSFSSHGAATSVSVYYDDVADTFKCVLAGLGTVNISDTMTLADLKTALDALIGGTNPVVITGDSSVKAYLLDCVINDTSFASNSAYYWEKVPYPGSLVPFGNAASKYNDSDYEGISAVNLNNSIYITDGGFPFKYDGKAVYRAGLPRTPEALSDTTGYNGFVYSNPANFAEPLPNWPVGSYYLRSQIRFRDLSGQIVYGKTQPFSSTYNSSAGANYVTVVNKNISIAVKSLKDSNFPIHACKVKTTTTITSSGSTTIPVNDGHNIKAGQCLILTGRFYTDVQVNFEWFVEDNERAFYLEVLSVSNTAGSSSITVNNPNSFALVAYSGVVANASYVPSEYYGRVYFPKPNEAISLFGPHYVLYSTKAGVNKTSSYYETVWFPIPHDSTTEYTIRTASSRVSSVMIDETVENELPRACRYISQWQGQLVQSGRPYDKSLSLAYYPTVYNAPLSTGAFGTRSEQDKLFDSYTEASLCDYQSIYWSDALAPEGFPQDGLHEIAIDTVFSDRVTGMIKNKDAFFVFKERSTALLTGSVATNDIQIEVLESDCGCVSHKSVKEVRGSVFWLDKYNGFFSCVAGRLPVNIGFPIQDYMKNNDLNLNFTKATAANFRKESLYVCSVGTTTFVFDYCNDGNLARDCWYLWDRVNGKSIVATSDDKLLINDGINTWKMKLTKTKYDMTDHKSAIPFVLNTAWSHAGAPTIDKHYIGLWINSVQGDFTLSVKEYGNYLEDLIGTQSNVLFIPENSSKKAIKAQVKAAIPKLSSISFGMENSEKNKLVKIQGFEIQLSVDFDGGEPKK